MSFDFSPEFEARLARGEKQAAEREGRAERRRQRLRKTVCCIPDCDTQVRRAQEFPLCVNHMVKIWELVEAKGRWSAAWGSLTDNGLTPEEGDAQRYAAQVKQRSAATRQAAGHLYVLDTRDGLVKIGWSKDGWKRMSQYPPTFRLIVMTAGTRADERDIHRSLRNSKVTGREWYEVTPEVVRQINHLISMENTRRAQSHSRRLAEYNPSWSKAFHPGELKLLPKFTTLDEWEGGPLGTFADARKPAPKSRAMGRRVA